MSTLSLEQLAQNKKIKVHDPFAEFLLADAAMHSFEISLLDCYRLAGHACHAMTGAFLMSELAIEHLYENKICERGDMLVEFGSPLNERASGPKSQIISYITGAWGPTGFPGLGGERYRRRDLLSFGHEDLPPSAVRFSRISTGQSIVIEYAPQEFLSEMACDLPFPEKWRFEITEILKNVPDILAVTSEAV